jgi:aminomethyltransferase
VSSDPPGPLKKTPLYEEHKRLKARLVGFAGYEMPIQYRGVSEEHRAVRSAAGVFDVSHMGELWLSGPTAGQVVDSLITNDATRLVDGQALYTCCCNDQGTILDDLIVYRRSQEQWLIVCNASNREKMVAHFQAAAAKSAEFRDASDETSLIALQGPAALTIAARLGEDGEALAALPSFHFRSASLAGVLCTAARTGYTGEDGLEVFCDAADAPRLFSAMLDEGAAVGAQPAGLGARDTLRLEARLSLYGNDIDETTNPIEAGLGWVVKLDKPGFVGKAALAAVKEAGPTRKLVGFEMVGKGIARHGYALLDESSAVVGVCTSGSPGPTVGKNIGLGYVPTSMSKIGTKLFVDCRGRSIEAVVVKTPFYKRAG